MTDSPCAVCKSGAIEIIPAFSALPRVTSDCRPFPAGGKLGFCRACGTVQKPADADWRSEVRSIYARYDMYRQAADRTEQAVFDGDSGVPTRRSSIVLGRLNAAHPFPAAGHALDVGCGNGPMLRALSKMAPGWDLSGHEISDVHAGVLASIEGFRELFTGELADIALRFDLITLNQSLEHLPDPVAALATLRGKLTPGGRLLVQAPNARVNDFDLLVADHRSHFDALTLARCAQEAGFRHFAVRDDWVFKELTMIASDSPLTVATNSGWPAPMTAADLDRRIDWLSSVLGAATGAADAATGFGIFGTSIAGTWLFGPLSERVAFFVDEDASRIGQRHEERPILAPAQVPADAAVYVPLHPAVAERVSARLKALGLNALTPPPHG